MRAQVLVGLVLLHGVGISQASDLPAGMCDAKSQELILDVPPDQKTAKELADAAPACTSNLDWVLQMYNSWRRWDPAKKFLSLYGITATGCLTWLAVAGYKILKHSWCGVEQCASDRVPLQGEQIANADELKGFNATEFIGRCIKEIYQNATVVAVPKPGGFRFRNGTHDGRPVTAHSQSVINGLDDGCVMIKLAMPVIILALPIAAYAAVRTGQGLDKIVQRTVTWVGEVLADRRESMASAGAVGDSLETATPSETDWDGWTQWVQQYRARLVRLLGLDTTSNAGCEYNPAPDFA